MRSVNFVLLTAIACVLAVPALANPVDEAGTDAVYAPVAGSASACLAFSGYPDATCELYNFFSRLNRASVANVADVNVRRAAHAMKKCIDAASSVTITDKNKVEDFCLALSLQGN